MQTETPQQVIPMLAEAQPRKMPLMTNPEKSDHFAIGVTSDQYWLITGMAHGNRTNRKAMLQEIIDHYIKYTFSKEST